jgi:hypothetical protein
MDLRAPMPFGRRELAGGEDPFMAMRREMDRLFDDLGRQAGLPRSLWGEAPGSLKVDVRRPTRPSRCMPSCRA